MQIQFDHPEYLLGFGLIPLFIGLAWKNKALLGKQIIPVILFRSLVVGAVVLALAGLKLQINSDRTAVVYVLDQSESIEQASREQMLEFATRHANRYRDQSREDFVGAVVFGGEASIAVPPYAGELPTLKAGGMPIIDTESTNIEQAIALARATFPTAARKRIVIVTDGNQTNGQLEKAVHQASESGIGIDVVPVSRRATSDVIIERIDVPSNIRSGQSFEGRVVMTCMAPDASESSQVISRGDLIISLKAFSNETIIVSSPVELTPGTNVFPFRYTVETPASYTFDAKFVPVGSPDAHSLNNRASSFALVTGKSRVLLIEPWNEPGQHQMLVDLLERDDIDVDVQPSNATFSSLSDLLGYDLVVLANMPKTSGETVDMLTSFTAAQLELLERNARQFGAGLLMVGGPESFGAGGWNGSILEKAMPVDFDVKNTKVNAVGALMVVIDSSGSMAGEKIQLCKAAAKEAIQSLREVDYVGVLTFDSETTEIIPLQKVGKRTHILPRIGRIGASGGTNMFPAMQQGFRRLSKVDAMVKHMIVLSDGQTPSANFDSLVSQMQDAGITVTTVAIGNDADALLMNRIASGGAGKFYKVISPKAIPRIVMRESRRIAKPLIYENPDGISADVRGSHPVTRGINSLPPFTGFVLTSSKENSLVQDLITANEPNDSNHPILSLWQYGLGRTAVWTSDSGQRWTNSWTSWPDQQKLYTQLVRWLMRPQGNTSDYQVVTSVEGDRVNVVVNAMSDEGVARQFLEIQSAVLGPGFEAVDLQLRQTGPGRYAGSFPATQAGTYFVNLVPGESQGAIVTGVSVPFGNEFREFETNWNTLEMMAATVPKGGVGGAVLPTLDQLTRERVASEQVDGKRAIEDPFRAGLAGKSAIDDVWPWVVLIACGLFLGDVTLRRVRVDFSRILTAFKKANSAKDAESIRSSRLDQLSEVKQRLSRQLDAKQAETHRLHVQHETPSLATEKTDGDYLQRLKDAKSKAK